MESSSILLNFVMFLITFHGRSGLSLNKVNSNVDVTYEELKQLNATCPPFDSCLSEKRTWSGSNPEVCSCDNDCAQFGTCCVDSRYRRMEATKPKPTCRTVYGNRRGYLIIDQCPFDKTFPTVFETLCNDEWNGEDDIMRVVPVTSVFTQKTYKNYFCFRCHENNDEYFYWDVKLEFKEENSSRNVRFSDVTVVYNRYNGTWMAQIGEGSNAFSIPVKMQLNIPDKFSPMIKTCYLKAASECSESWTDDQTRIKCSRYMATVIIERDEWFFYYKNPHCALCNYEDLAHITCVSMDFGSGWDSSKKPFSFSMLMDINQSDGDKVGKKSRCGDRAVWDPYFEKCRPLVCATPGHVVKGRTCGPP